jgi:hypothetical protein
VVEWLLVELVKYDMMKCDIFEILKFFVGFFYLVGWLLEVEDEEREQSGS